MAASDRPVGTAEDEAARALRLHETYRGKMQTVPKCPVRSRDDYAVWYTPGVAEPCRAIARDRRAEYMSDTRML